jgi:hypothetical protein
MKPHNSNALLNLVKGCVDAARTLRLESSFVTSPARRHLLVRMAEERSLAAQLLDNLDRPVHPLANVGGTWLELLRELQTSIATSFGAHNDNDALENCLQSHDRIEALYEMAIAHNAHDEEMRRTLVAQCERLRHQRSALLAAEG